MRDSFLPFSKPDFTEQDITNVGEVLRSGWITTGPKCAEFEDKFCEYTGASFAVALTSATGGMHIVLKALNIGPGDEVITPSMTWVSTINMIVLAGATPVFVDVNKDTLMASAEDIEKKITKRTKAIIPVHYAGAPADLDGIYALGEKYNLSVIEDAAHAIGTFYKGEHVGKKGIAIYSFHPIKNITTCEGGMVTVNNQELADKIKRLKFHGLGVDAFDRKMQGRAPKAQVLEPGFKYNMTDVSAVLGLGQLARIDEFNSRRRELAEYYREALKEVPGVTPLSSPDYDHLHAQHLFIVRIDEQQTGCDRDRFMELLKERNVGTGLHFLAAHTHSFYSKNYPVTDDCLKNTEYNSERICSIPLFPAMSDKDAASVIAAIKDVVNG